MKNTFLQRSSTWLMLCLIYLSSCRNDVQIVPSDTKTEQLSSDIQTIKTWFENNTHSSNLVSCNTERNHIPRWDKSKDYGDRIEFDTWVNANNRVSLPKMAGTGLKSGRMKFVAIKKNGKGNGNGNIEGAIVNFIPFQSFTGDITQVSTTTFRSMQFSGIIAFEELNGCQGNAYLIEKGVVKAKLTIQNPNQITERCGEVYVTTNTFYTITTVPSHPEYGCTYNYYSSGQSISYGVPCISSSYPSYDSGMSAATSSSSSSTPYNDPTYLAYMTSGLLSSKIQYLCSDNITFLANNLDNSIKQQAGLDGLYANFKPVGSNTITKIEMPTLYFSADFHNSTGTVVMNSYEAASRVADAINKGENHIRDLWNKNEKPEHRQVEYLKNEWYNSINSYFTNFLLLDGRSIQVSKGIIIPDSKIKVEKYVPCN